MQKNKILSNEFNKRSARCVDEKLQIIDEIQEELNKSRHSMFMDWKSQFCQHGNSRITDLQIHSLPLGLFPQKTFRPSFSSAKWTQ